MTSVATPPRRLRVRGRLLTLPAGTVPVAGGTVASGVAAYLFLVLSARALGPVRDASLSALWTLAFLMGPGCFSPLEREVSRALAGRLAHGMGGRPVVVRCAEIGGLFSIGVVALGAGAGLALEQRIFDGQALLVVGLLLALVGYYTMHLSWGALAGARHFTGYGTVTAAEGLSRLAICVALVAVGTHTAGPYGVAIGVAPFVAALVGWRVEPVELEPGPPLPWAQTTRDLGYLLGSSFLTQFVLLIGPVAVKLLSAPGDEAAAGRFLAGMTLVRVPLFLFNAVLAPLLPRLANLVSAGKRLDFRELLLRLSVGIVALSVLSALGAGLAGPALLRLMFGPGFALPGADLAALALAAGAYLLASLLSFGIIAIGDHAWTTISWTSGVVVFVLLVAATGDVGVVSRVEIGFLGGCVVTASTMVGFLIRRYRQADWSSRWPSPPADLGGIGELLPPG